MRAAIDQTDGLVYSSAVLADLLESGMEREKAYRAVQAAANRTVASGDDFAASLRPSQCWPGSFGPSVSWPIMMSS